MFNPFEEKPKNIESTILTFKEMNSKPYDKNDIDPYTKTRIILMNGNEYEAVWFSHQFQRHCDNNDVRRQLALTRRIEQQQQKAIASLKPIDESLLEHTISYEQLAVDLTAFLAQRATDRHFKDALDFALLEDFDHLYRYSDLLDMDDGVKAERLVGKYTEIMPGRPTIAHQRHPFDSIKDPISRKESILTKLDTHIITAAEQQTMNYYMNQANFYKNELGRKLYTEIGMVEEQHVTQYGSFIDPTMTWFECCLFHEYLECYLYYSMMKDESDDYIKKIWERSLEQEIAHLHMSAKNLKKYEGKDYNEIIPNEGKMPELLKLESNKDYIRKILGKTVRLTANREEFEDVSKMPDNAGFFKYQKAVGNNKSENVASHIVIEKYIKQNGEDYRYEEKEHPVKELRDRKEDNVTVGLE